MSRPIWSGSVVFGLVNVPVQVHTAIRDHSIHLHMLSKEGDCRLRRKMVCPETGKEYDFKDTARGYEVAPGQYVIIDEDELQQVKPEKGRTINIVDFVDLAEIDPMYFDNTYYLAPGKQAGKGYELLVEALAQKNKAGIARVVMRDKEYLVALRSEHDVLVMETMHFADEIVPARDVVERPRSGKLDKREVTMAGKLIDAMVRDFDPQRYKDDYRERLQDLIERKAEGEKIKVEKSAPAGEGKTLNFMKALEASLQEAKHKARARAPRGGSTRKAPARRRKSA